MMHADHFLMRTLEQELGRDIGVDDASAFRVGNDDRVERWAAAKLALGLA